MTIYDGSRLIPAIEDVSARGLKPEFIVADTHYGSSENVDKADERQVSLVSPVMTARGSKRGMLTLEHFEVDEGGLILRCPGGRPPVATHLSKVKLEARFDPEICGTCHLRNRCPTQTSWSRGRRCSFQYTHERVLQRSRRMKEKTDSFRDRYRWRAGVEATMSRLKHQMNLGALRIREQEKVRYVTFLRALGLNIHRCASVLT